MEFGSREAALVWLAGLLEGEGCFNLPRANGNSVRVRLVMTDEDVVRTAVSIFPSSVPVREKWGRSGAKICQMTYCADWMGNHAVGLMNAVLPYMHSRRAAKIKELLQRAELRPLWVKKRLMTIMEAVNV